MGKQVDYPADTVGIDGTVYPTVGENIRHFIPLDGLTWVDVSFHVTKGTKPDDITFKGKYAGIFYLKSIKPESLYFTYYQHVLIEGTDDITILSPRSGLYNYFNGDITLSLLVKK